MAVDIRPNSKNFGKWISYILDDKLNVRIGIDDILFTSPWSGTTQFGDLFIDGSGGGDSRQFKMNLTYNFGSNEVKKARNRKTGIEDKKNIIE